MTSTAIFLDNTDRFTAVVAATTDWAAPSACTEWTAADLVKHVVKTQRDFLRRHGAGRDTPDDSGGGSTVREWRTHVDGVHRALRDRPFATRQFDGSVGPTTVEEMLAGFYGFDLTVHRWDLGWADGQDVRFTDDELIGLDRQVDALGEQFYRSGASAAPLDAAPDASAQTRVLARMGRQG